MSKFLLFPSLGKNEYHSVRKENVYRVITRKQKHNGDEVRSEIILDNGNILYTSLEIEKVVEILNS